MEAVVTHGPKAAVRFDQQTIDPTTGDRYDVVGNDFFRSIGINVIVCAVAKLTDIINPHGPKTTVGFEKHTVKVARGNRHDAIGEDLLRYTGLGIGSTIAQLAGAVVTHGPKTAVGFKKQVVIQSGCNRSHAVGNNQPRRISRLGSTKLAKAVEPHAPNAAVGFEKQAEYLPASN